MRQFIKYSALAGAIASLVACGGGGGSSPETSQVAGLVADGYLRGAIVCLDQDLDGSCVGEEVRTVSEAGGKYSLSVPSGVDASAFPIVVVVGTDAFDEGEPGSTTGDVQVEEAFTLASPPGKSAFVSPLTTLIYKIARNNTAEELKRVEDEIKDQMGISGSATDLYADFVSKSETGNETAEYTKLFRTAQLLARHFATTETAIKNLGANKADVSKVASLKAMEQLNTISGIVTTHSENFNIKELVKQNKAQWQDAVKDIKSADDIAKIKSAAKLPRVFDAGVYQYVDKTASPVIDTKEAMIIFFAKKTDFTNWDIQLQDVSGNLIYTFKDSDIDRPLFTRANYLAFSTQLPALANGEYKFFAKAKDGNSDAFELFSTTLATANVDTTPASDNETGSTVNSRVVGSENRLMISVPYGKKDIRYAALLLDANRNILDINTWRNGKNLFYFDPAHKDSAKNIAVYANDGGRLADSNIVFKRVDKPLLLSDSATEFGWSRANIITTKADSDTEKFTEITFNNDLEGFKDVQVLPLSTLTLSRFDGSSYIDKANCSQSGEDVTCTQSGINVGTEFFAANGTGYSTHHYGINNELTGFAASTVFPTGNYKLTATDSNGKSDTGFVNLSANQYMAFAIKGSDLSIDSVAGLKDGWMDATVANVVSGYYYQVDFRIEYTRDDGKSKTAFVGKTPRSASGTAVFTTALLKSKVEKRIATLKTGGHTPNKLIVRLNAFDALHSSNVNNAWYTKPVDTGYFTELF